MSSIKAKVRTRGEPNYFGNHLVRLITAHVIVTASCHAILTELDKRHSLQKYILIVLDELNTGARKGRKSKVKNVVKIIEISKSSRSAQVA